ncbi:MAG: abortive infection family protein [Bacilli bacterium]
MHKIRLVLNRFNLIDGVVFILVKIESIESLKNKVLTYVQERMTIGKTEALLAEINSEFKTLRPILNKLNEKYPSRFHGGNYIEYSREFSEFHDLVKAEVNDNAYYGFANEKSFYTSFFNQYANFFENQSIEIELIPVQTPLSDYHTLDVIRGKLDECDLYIHNGTYGAAVTVAKTLLEGVFKEIIRTESPEFLNEHKKFQELRKKAFDILEFNAKNESYNNDLKRLVGNVATIVDTINAIRNEVGIGHPSSEQPNLAQALLVVNAAKTVTTFILQTFDQRNK